MGSSAPAARLCPGSELWPGEGLATPPAAKGRRPLPTHRDDVVLAEAQLVVVMALEVQQGLGSVHRQPWGAGVLDQMQLERAMYLSKLDVE